MNATEIFCTCCARPFIEEWAGQAPHCASDLVDGAIAVNHGSSYPTGSVLLAVHPGALDILDGVICDLCIEHLIRDGHVFSA